MGIKQLSKLLKEKASRGISLRKHAFYNSYTVAIDASLALYQFLIAVRSDGSNLGTGEGDTTSHIVGVFYRTVKMIESGIIPVYVFDGDAPEMKIHELQKRAEKREKADLMLKVAEAVDDKISVEKYERRKVKVERSHVDDCKKLLMLMGVPAVTAPSEAEAHCAFLCKEGCVRAVATEDMDALCFGTPILLRNMNASQSKSTHIEEYNLDVILRELGMSMESFIDLCILLGCDYCTTIKGIGYKRAYDLIKKHGTIEKILENEQLKVESDFDYSSARNIFMNLALIGEKASPKIDYDEIDDAGLIKFLCVEKGFDEKRVVNAIERIRKTKGKTVQKKLESFFMKAS